jgi:hypothetical protein
VRGGGPTERRKQVLGKSLSLSLAAKVLAIIAVFSLLLTATGFVLFGTGTISRGQTPLAGEGLTEATPDELAGFETSGYHYSNLFWLSPVEENLAPNDTEAWEIPESKVY